MWILWSSSYFTSLNCPLFSFFFFAAGVFFLVTPAIGVLCKTSARDRPVSSLHVGSSWVTISWPTFLASFAGGIWRCGLAVIAISTAFLSPSALFLPEDAWYHVRIGTRLSPSICIFVGVRGKSRNEAIILSLFYPCCSGARCTDAAERLFDCYSTKPGSHHEEADGIRHSDSLCHQLLSPAPVTLPSTTSTLPLASVTSALTPHHPVIDLRQPAIDLHHPAIGLCHTCIGLCHTGINYHHPAIGLPCHPGISLHYSVPSPHHPSR